MSGLEEGLERVASAGRLLVASDFDGTLAPIADLPDEVRPDDAACEALRALSRLDRTDAVVISGRARAVLRELLGGHADGIRLVGSHGAELDEEPALQPADARRREALIRTFEALAERHAGALVEPKPYGVAFHYRRVREAEQEGAARAARQALRSRGVRVQEGHKVVEAVVLEADKGTALAAVREGLGSDATFFIGDDVTDEHVFRRLEPDDLGVKVGPGATAAAVRVDGQAEVAGVLERLRALRARHLEAVAEARPG